MVACCLVDKSGQTVASKGFLDSCLLFEISRQALTHGRNSSIPLSDIGG